MKFNNIAFLHGYLGIGTGNKCDLSSVGYSSNMFKKCLFHVSSINMYVALFILSLL